MVQIVGKDVGPIGYGLMGLTWRPKPCPQEQAFEAMRTALELDSNCWNGGEFYGPPEYNSLVLLERYLAQYPEDAGKFLISIKGGMNPATGHSDGSAENTRRTIDDSLAQLKGRLPRIDVFEFARRDPDTPLALTLGTIDREYVRAGKVGGVALSEVRAETIHEAVKHTKIVAVECELSLFATDVLENGVAAALIAYSPLGRGLLTGQIKTAADIPADSPMRRFPRFQPGNLETNLQLVAQVEDMAARKGCTPAQLAINWTRALARRPGMPDIVPIPGATTADRVRENCKLVDLSDDDMAQIDATLAKFTPAGARYPDSVPTNT
ncbi:Aldo/keto reductase [Hypoxylon sp. FL1284]|nr:Aldo/keto reductase [Hypoxylon sp. FL1284]